MTLCFLVNAYIAIYYMVLLQLQVTSSWGSVSSLRGLSSCGTSEWIDPDTPTSACQKTDYKGAPLELVFSDEFDVAGRTFRDGHDSRWAAINGFPDGNEQINAYDDAPEFSHTADGLLKLKVDAQQTILNYTDWSTGQSRSSQTRTYTTPMLQTWNKFCFAGGRIELSAQLPGLADQAGIWPAFWLMGNLGRATVTASTEKMWPYSYDHCPSADQRQANQYVEQNQMINKCRDKSWTDRYGLNPHQGRGAIEIDIIEAMPGTYTYDYKLEQVASGHCPPLKNEEEYKYLRVKQPMVATSLQLAPGILYKADQRPKDADAGYLRNCLPEDWTSQWYPELQPGNVNAPTYGTDYASSVNIDFWGDYFESEIPWQTDSMSARHELPLSAFDSQNIYTLEWISGKDGYVRFLLNDKLQYHINSSTAERDVPVSLNGTSVGELLGRKMPVEPSYIMLNIDLSPRWGFPYCPPDKCDCCYDCRDPKCTTCMDGNYNYMGWLKDLCTTLPATYDVDWVRVYQHPGATDVGCSTKAFPSEGWIESHRKEFTVPNMDEPLRPVLAGGAQCTADAGDCGHHRGDCVNATCRCRTGWTGPRCLSTQVGSSAICRQLEEAAIGGAPCDTHLTDECGAQQGTGACVELWKPWDRPTQELVMPDGTLQLAGGGNGRCECASGWGGTHCNKPLADASASKCLPDASLPSAKLEILLDSLCMQVKSEAVVALCNTVQWKPHWQSGGEFSTCGAWLRSSTVLQAVADETGMCCSKPVWNSKQPQCTDEPGLPLSGEECFLRADYGNGAAALEACPWARIEGVYAPQAVINEAISQSWFPTGSPARNTIVLDAVQCQQYCLESPACSFFSYDGTSRSCWLKSSVNCTMQQAFTLSFNLISGPKIGCISSGLVLNESGVPLALPRSTTTAPAAASQEVEAPILIIAGLAAGAGVFVFAALIFACTCCTRKYLARRDRSTCAHTESKPHESLDKNMSDIEGGKKVRIGEVQNKGSEISKAATAKSSGKILAIDDVQHEQRGKNTPNEGHVVITVVSNTPHEGDTPNKVVSKAVTFVEP
mmetsp:Transcript_151848/g.279884  ORF Transcript_151848/g.279884 Transcript_151848/m.279884 type:complete len:1058 (+) Transcript_151848:79-3252(+)